MNYIESIRAEWGESTSGETWESFLERKLAEARAGIDFWAYCMDQGMQATCPEKVEELCGFLMAFKVAPYSIRAKR